MYVIGALIAFVKSIYDYGNEFSVKAFAVLHYDVMTYGVLIQQNILNYD